ncbi:hypothetical protein TKK_0003138 [Trichogramma kaykai]
MHDGNSYAGIEDFIDLFDESDDDDDSDADYDFDHVDDCSSELKSARDRLNWTHARERRKFLRRCFGFAIDWHGPLPDLRGIFRREEMDWLLSEASEPKNMYGSFGPSLLGFVLRTGYRDEPPLVDEEGRPILTRCTADHVERIFPSELDRSDALTIIKIFAKHVGFDKTESSKKNWYNNKRFVSKVKELTINSSLSLYDLTRLRPEEAIRGRLVTLTDCLEFARSDYRDKNLPNELALTAYLFEIVTRKFSYSWGLEFFSTLTDCQLPILCCEKIIGHLNVEDLWRVCLAAKDQAN